MPEVRGEDVRVTEDDLNNVLGVAPAINQRGETSGQRLEVQRVIAYVKASEEPEDLKQIGRVLAKRLREMGAIRPKKKPRITDKALLYLYLNVSPVLLSLLIVMPLMVWLGRVAVREMPPYIPSMIFGARFWSTLRQACPPNCTWHHLAMWAVLGGVSLLTAFLVSYALRKRLLKAIP
jgi:hypothetical protein